MIKKVFVGNLPWSVRTAELSQLLSDLGIAFRSAKVVEDRETGQSRGFGFIEVDGEDEMRRAISVLSGYIVDGRPLNANEAKPKGGNAGGGPGSASGGPGSSGGRSGGDPACPRIPGGQGGQVGPEGPGGQGGKKGGGSWDEEGSSRGNRRDGHRRDRQGW